MISSHHNETLKDIRRLLARKQPGRFVAEGEDLLAAADAAGWEPVVRLKVGEDVTAEALAKVSALGSGSREVAIYEERWGVPEGPIAIALWGVKDPGNVGTVLRGALAFGAASVAIGPDTADPYGPKAVRASMGAVFTQAVAAARWDEFLPWLRSGEGQLVGTSLKADRDYLDAAYERPCFVLIGNEQQGLPDAYEAQCDSLVKIPMSGRADSLNAAVAAAVMAFAIRASWRG